MEKLAFIYERLKQAPFSLDIPTLSDLDSKSSYELLDISCDVIISIDNEMEILRKEDYDMKVHRIMGFLTVMKFPLQESQIENFQSYLMQGDKDTIYDMLSWCLSKYEVLQKRAYLARYLMPVDIPPEFIGEDLIGELSERLKQMQAEFKVIHKTYDQSKGNDMRPADYKNEITQLENERIQLSNRIQKLKKDSESGGKYFQEMFKYTSALRKEQEEEQRIHEKIRENRAYLQEVDKQYSELNRRVAEMKKQGLHNQSAEEILSKLQSDVKELTEKKDAAERNLTDRVNHLNKLHGWDNSDRNATEDDVRAKKEQLHEIEDDIATLQERLDKALEKNNNLAVFRQASMMAYTKLCERETEVNHLMEEKANRKRQIEEKERELESQGRHSSSSLKKDIKKYGEQVRNKIETYKKMRDEIKFLREELVILQRTEQILRGRDKNLEDFLVELERKKGVEGYRDTMRTLVDVTEKTSEIDQMKGATLEEISAMVEQIGKEFKTKQMQLQPMMAELKSLRHDYMELETRYNEAKGKYDKVAIALELDKQSLEKDCDSFQEECLAAESKYHILNCLISSTKIRLQRAEQEKKWLDGNGRLLRDFASYKELYTHKLTQQDHLTKQLRKQEKELNENSYALTNQKTNFANLQLLLSAKVSGSHANSSTLFLGNANVMAFDN